jgi:5-methylthioadenosine/S-adenosylhomocysteine deaminase
MNEILITDAAIAVPHSSTAGKGWVHPGEVLIRDGRIESITPARQPREPGPSTQVISARGMAAIPALVNGHTHLSQTFMRGLAGGRPLLRWLKELIWPLQDAMSEEVLELAALLGLAENARCGAGSVVDHQKITRSPAFTEAVMRAAQRSGLRVCAARAWADRGAGAESPDRILDELEGLFERNQPGGQVSFASGPLSPWRCSAETLQAAHALAVRFDSFTHIHVSETSDEVAITEKESGLRPVAWLDSLGVLDRNCQVVHAVWVDDAEIDLLAARQSPVVHCPVSNAVLGSGIAPLKAMLEKKVDLRLGTDGPASNDTQDCIENMKMAICMARASSRDAAALSPRAALNMAAASTGLSAGQPADLALLRLDTLSSAPLHDLDSAATLCVRAADVDSLMVDGKFILSGGKLETIDEQVLLKEATLAVKSLRRKAGLDL